MFVTKTVNFLIFVTISFVNLSCVSFAGENAVFQDTIKCESDEFFVRNDFTLSQLNSSKIAIIPFQSQDLALRTLSEKDFVEISDTTKFEIKNKWISEKPYLVKVCLFGGSEIEEEDFLQWVNRSYLTWEWIKETNTLATYHNSLVSDLENLTPVSFIVWSEVPIEHSINLFTSTR